jgi:hypothetical protein
MSSASAPVIEAVYYFDALDSCITFNTHFMAHKNFSCKWGHMCHLLMCVYHPVITAAHEAAVHFNLISCGTSSRRCMVMVSPAAYIIGHDSGMICLCRFCILTVTRDMMYFCCYKSSQETSVQWRNNAKWKCFRSSVININAVWRTL